MDTTRIEILLEQLIDKQDDLIRRIESLETEVVSELSSINSEITEVKYAAQTTATELEWWKDTSFAAMALKSLNAIDDSIIRNG
jgi:hypothetical protein